MADNTWYTVDNVAKVFLASSGERDTRTFRISCTLTEKIDGEILNGALKAAILERPQYQVTIRRGLFWHYMEYCPSEPVAVCEDERPCPVLYSYQAQNPVHYKVSYYNNRINLDMFHALADGNGGVEFMNLIVSYYLKTKYPDKFEDLSMNTGASKADLDDDSYRHFYNRNASLIKKPEKKKEKKAYHIRGLKHPYNQLQFFEVHIPVKPVLTRAKEMGVTLTSYLGASLMFAIRDDMPSLKKEMPITISMPVNLRNYYSSNTSRNFFNSVTVSHSFTPDEDFETVAKEYDKKLRAELTPEAVAQRMDNYELMERLFFVRMIPLFIKNPIVNMGVKKEARKVTAVISNLGRIQIPEAIKDYVSGYSAYCSTNSLFITCGSFGDDLVLGIACAYQNTGVLRSFISNLSKDGADALVYATEVE